MYIKKIIDQYLSRKIRKIVNEVLVEKNHDIKFGLQNLALQETCEWIKTNVPIHKVYEDRFALLSEAINQVKIKNGLYLEFGVYKGETIKFISSKIGADNKIYGFDSFEGLKEPWIFNSEGGFSDVNDEALGKKNNIEIIKGYFSDSLPTFFNELKKPISFLHIDSDLYTSANTIFNYVSSNLKVDSVIVFDEFFNFPNWQNQEYKAWLEFVEKNKVEYEYIGYTYQRTKFKKSGNQLALRITKI